MRTVYAVSDNLVSSLGFSTEENVINLKKGISGIASYEDKTLSQQPFFASRIDDSRINEAFSPQSDLLTYTRLEKLFIFSINAALQNIDIDIKNPKTLLIISTTKGNVDLLALENKALFERDRLYLWKMAEIIATHFNHPSMPIVVSNACISGILAIIIGARFIESGKYDHVVISGGDLLTEFVMAGFQSFKALGSTPCKPFDANRDGLTLGEGCGTIILSADPTSVPDQHIIFAGGCSSNDANHISGPSRTGDELFYAIQTAMFEANVASEDISFINAHGTATLFNDEMESKSFTSAGLEKIPLNSLKGYFGHTLGAAGVIETIIGINSLKNDFLIMNKGYSVPDPSISLNVIDSYCEKPLHNFLKTASGFGGCNAVGIFSKI